MTKSYRIELNELDIGQLIDGLNNRAEAWEKTAKYLRANDMPEDEFFLIEECSDADEADQVAKHFRSIVIKIQKQLADGSR